MRWIADQGEHIARLARLPWSGDNANLDNLRRELQRTLDALPELAPATAPDYTVYGSRQVGTLRELREVVAVLDKAGARFDSKVVFMARVDDLPLLTREDDEFVSAPGVDIDPTGATDGSADPTIVIWAHTAPSHE